MAQNPEVKKSGILFGFYLCEFLSSKFNLLVSFLVFSV